MYTSPSWTGVALCLLGPVVCAAASSRAPLELDCIMVFGDSYSATGYDPSIGMSPTIGQNLTTTTGGLVWAQYLGLAAGAEERTFDFAVIGATIDNDLVDGGEVPSLVEQVDTFRDYFAPIDSEVAWSSNGTLFTLFFGVNDIGLSYYYRVDFPPLLAHIFSSYLAQVARLYRMGARRFLILSVPPTDKSPLIQERGPVLMRMFRKNIHLWNTALDVLVRRRLPWLYPGAEIVFFDTHALISSIIHNPARYALAPAVSTTYCLEYSWVVNEPEVHLMQCYYPLSAYVWYNDYHVSWPVHKLVAEGVEIALRASTRKEITDGRTSATKSPGYGSRLHSAVVGVLGVA